MRRLLLVVVPIAVGCSDAASPVGTDDALLRALVLPASAQPPPDPTNRHADDPRAAKLGQRLFFDPGLSGPLLDSANDGLPGTLGKKGDAGKVACASCHVPGPFVDTRSVRGQLSLGSGWTHRRAPTLLDVSQATFLTWDGHRDTAFSQPFGPLENALEMNSSRLFVAEQIAKRYRADYEAIFGPLPSLDAYPDLAPKDAGCATIPSDPVHATCGTVADETVTRIVVNVGKAIQAYTRKLGCGRSRFDAWMDGDANALNADEQAGAHLFVGKGGCSSCHGGPYLTDQRFHNIGVPGSLVPTTGVNTANDPGAAEGLADVKKSPLNSRGIYSDGDDGRLDAIAGDTSSYLGAFRTAPLRCSSRRPSFMHNGELRSLEAAVHFFSEGAPRTGGYAGTSENYRRHLTEAEEAQIVAFLRALDGPGPSADLLSPP